MRVASSDSVETLILAGHVGNYKRMAATLLKYTNVFTFYEWLL